MAELKARGNACFKARDFLGAIEWYGKGVDAVHGDSDPTLASVLRANRAMAHLKAIEDPGTRVRFGREVSAMDEEMMAFMWESEVLRHLDKAVADSRAAVALDETNGKAHFRLGAALLERVKREDEGRDDGLEQLREAVGALDSSLALADSDATRTKRAEAAALLQDGEALKKMNPIGGGAG